VKPAAAFYFMLGGEGLVAGVRVFRGDGSSNSASK